MSFFDSLIKIGQGFQEIFGFFGNAIGDALGLTAVKSGAKRSKVGEHFDKIKKGLGDTKDKLKELSGEISEAKNANSSTIEAVKSAISSANDVFERLIIALTKLADTAKEAGNIDIGDSGAAAAGAGATAKLAAEVSKADSWAKINSAKTAVGVQLDANTNYGAGELATGTPNQANGSKAATNADLAAAVALKAMTKGGKFSNAANEADAVKAAAISAVNKVLGVLDVIIRKTVASNLNKIRETVKGIQYSETTTESTEASTTQPVATK
ncbi:variable large family protein (plasmid) [Borrelia parkeri]|nr:variable large family protein [Borrelia parkeri]